MSETERSTTERVLALLGLLQQRRVWTGPELAERLGVTPRTVRRDVGRLRALGYPVHAGKGTGGGYQLGRGQDLPPLLLDDEEATATAAALLAGAGSADASAAGTASREATLRALGKLDRVLPARLRHEVRALSGSFASFGAGRVPPDPEALMTLARACRDEVEVAFTYSPGVHPPDARSPGAHPPGEHPSDSRPPGALPSGGEVRRRRVEPYRLVASDRHWYLFAYDLDRDGWRTFRLDRMSEVTARTWRFRPRPAPDAATYVQEGVTSRVYLHRARLLVHAPAGTVRAQVPASAAVITSRGRGRCELMSGAADLDRVLLHVLLLGHDFEVIDPPELAERCRVLGERLLAAGRRQMPPLSEL